MHILIFITGIENVRLFNFDAYLSYICPVKLNIRRKKIKLC